MNNEVAREDSDSTERRTWTAAEAAAHPALGLGSTDSLSRQPRGSQAPKPASSETVVTPAPQFDGSGERIDASELVMSAESEDDLDGIVELSSTMLVEDAESSEVELLSDGHIVEVTEDVAEIDASDVLEEVDSELLSFVEARGEITDKPQRAPSPVEVSKVSLSALHETLHNQAVDSGMATYSTGVPIHSLDRDSETGKTIQIQRPAAQTTSFTTRNILMASVFLAGIGAGVFFGLPESSSASTKAAPAITAAAVIIPADASEQSLKSTNNDDVDSEVPVVAPLVEITEDPQIGEEEAEAALSADEEPADDIDVRPLEVETVAVAAPQMPAEVSAPSTPKTSRRAKSTTLDGIAPNSFGKGDPGVLMLGAKPPCDIFIDGKKTGLKTPQRLLRLPPGKHKITLINQEHKLRDSFRVSIQSGKKTRIVRDMTSKLR
jgi:hypothetical protein